MLILQIYVVTVALAFVLTLKAFEIMPSGPNSSVSAVLISLIAGITWPLLITAVLVEMKARNKNE